LAEKEKQERKVKKSGVGKAAKSSAEAANEDRPLLDRSTEPATPESPVAEANGVAHAADAAPGGDPC
jgi:hypothetical protein